MDFVTDLPESTASGYAGILVIVDFLTKMATYLPCREVIDSPELALVLATGPGNPPAVRIWTGKTVWFASRTVQKPDPLLLGGPNPDPYP